MDHTFIDDPVKAYLTEVDKVPPLTRDEELRCIQDVREESEQAETAGMRLLATHLRLVVSIAEQHRNRGIHVLDLIQRGNEGLLDALRELVVSEHENFAALAREHVERAIEAAIVSDSP